MPTIVYSASLLLTNKIFICGGEDFKLYKYNYETGTEIGKYAHCLAGFGATRKVPMRKVLTRKVLLFENTKTLHYI